MKTGSELTPSGRIKVTGTKFSNRDVLLDGHSFYNCTFSDCNIMVEKGDFDLVGCGFNNCKLSLRGNAAGIAKAIKLFYPDMPIWFAEEETKQQVLERMRKLLLKEGVTSLDLHPKIRDASERLFKNGHYSQAILEAFKALCNFVKEKSGRTDLDGRDLMAQVFSEKNPVIRLNLLEKPSEKDEQEGFKFIFMGAMEGIRNPRAHEKLDERDPQRVLEHLALASLLAKKVEEGKLETEARS